MTKIWVRSKLAQRGKPGIVIEIDGGPEIHAHDVRIMGEARVVQKSVPDAKGVHVWIETEAQVLWA
mgnify:CR=1 FL=1